jgi:hypothetical protein
MDLFGPLETTLLHELTHSHMGRDTHDIKKIGYGWRACVSQNDQEDAIRNAGK